MNFCKIFFISVFISYEAFSFSDTLKISDKKNIRTNTYLSLEGLGKGIFYSLNLEKNFKIGGKANFLSFTAGLGVISVAQTYQSSATFNFGNKKNYFEIGSYLGYFVNSDVAINQKNFVFFGPILGYKRNILERYFFRIYAIALPIKMNDYKSNSSFNDNEVNKYYLFPSVGVGFGIKL